MITFGLTTTGWPARRLWESKYERGAGLCASGGQGMTALRDRLAWGAFTITSELSPVRGASAEAMKERARLLLGWVDAVNLTDNQGAHVRMSSWASAIAAREAGLEPIMQMTCRDRNRIALPSDLLGWESVGRPDALSMS